MNKDELRALLRSGIEDAQNNNIILARSQFRQVLEEDPNNELAWMWLAQVVDSNMDRQDALQEVLRINPNNEKAREALKRMGVEVEDPNEDKGSRLSQVASRGSQPSRQVAQQQAGSESAPKDVLPQKRTNQPSELWGNQRNNRDNSQLTFLLIIAITGMVFIIGALLLLIDRVAAPEDETADPTNTSVAVVDGADTEVPTIAPANTNTPVVVVDTNTPASSPTPTIIPSATNTPLPTSTPLPPDDSFDMYLLGETRSGLELSLAAFDGSRSRDIDINFGEETSAEILDIAVNSAGSSLLVRADVGVNQELFIVDANGGAATQLTNLGSREILDPAWSPDGNFVAFASNLTGNFDLYVIEVASGDTVRLTETFEQERYPDWSPNGNYLLYTAGLEDGLETEIFVLDLTEVNIMGINDPLIEETADQACQLTRAAQTSFAPVWSPDGSQIAFLSNRSQSQETDLYIMSADGTATRLLTPNDADAQETSVSWSPDGRWIAVTSSRGQVVSEAPQPTAEPSVEPTAEPTEETSDEAEASEEISDDDSSNDEEAQVQATATVAQTDEIVFETNVWVYDTQNAIWYPVIDENVSKVIFQPSNNDVTPVESVVFQCQP